MATFSKGTSMQTKSLLALPRILPCCFLFLMLYSCNSTCSKTVSCPGYSSPLADSWFPYYNQQRLIFKNNGGLYDTQIDISFDTNGKKKNVFLVM